jgi:hypothetical protein
MTQTSLEELQTAIYSALTSDTTLMSTLTGVFDIAAVPENQAFPYVAIGDSTEGSMNAFGRRGYESTLTLHIWSSATGFKECYSILARMNFLLDQKILSLASQSHVFTLYDFSSTLNDPGENSIRHMPVRYRCFTQE